MMILSTLGKHVNVEERLIMHGRGELLPKLTIVYQVSLHFLIVYMIEAHTKKERLEWVS